MNSRTLGGETITVNTVQGQDWSTFTLAAAGSAGDSYIVKSENGTILFEAFIGSASDPTNYYSYEATTRTYTFYDDPNLP